MFCGSLGVRCARTEVAVVCILLDEETDINGSSSRDKYMPPNCKAAES